MFVHHVDWCLFLRYILLPNKLQLLILMVLRGILRWNGCWDGWRLFVSWLVCFCCWLNFWLVLLKVILLHWNCLQRIPNNCHLCSKVLQRIFKLALKNNWLAGRSTVMINLILLGIGTKKKLNDFFIHNLTYIYINSLLINDDDKL